MKNVILVLLVTFFSIAVQAQDKKKKNAKYETEVSGNCEDCKKRIEKAAFGVSGVKSAVWDVSTHKLSLILNEEKTSLVDVKNAIAKSGHDTDVAKTTQDVYDALPTCCKYERN
ncbi:heavy-metal-associated domain-containing protein [Flavobacterium branchiarum]|uniref:Heavy-metal-associated domain-containing protein n=1 Tax=Flavobacterium branchiarum TaxID=1114870 RepID=A0ABV5FLZ2_9FLAO|nr:heavy-metal-associated domain-containing protein [Flavobacterium branchiarum]MDN3674635.1 heavy-metal-associated domain-containing protein [Flavobacterium branchiarum]